jgi:hypothetical protein
MASRRKPKSGKAPTDIFAPTRRNGSGKRGPGRPPIHAEAWTKVTVVLFDRQIVFLDRLAASIRAQSGAAISRAQLLRSLVDAVADANIDLTSARSEAELKTAVLSRIGR